MNDQTQQFSYKIVMATVCAVVVLIFLFLAGSALEFGDGEAVKIIDSMTPIFIATLTGMASMVLGTHATSAYQAKQFVSLNIAKMQAASTDAQTAASAAATAQAGPTPIPAPPVVPASSAPVTVNVGTQANPTTTTSGGAA